MKSLRIVFMGTPEFAVASLEALVKSHHHIAAVVTAPDKPQGRGLQMTASPVKDFAVKHGLSVLQPDKLKSEDFQKELRTIQADLFVVVAFRMLPESVWSMPPMGTINLHASLLPKYRGAAPINWAIINGESETGITTFKLKQEIDTGNILFRESEPIFPEDDAGSLYERLMIKGADLIVKTVNSLADGTATEVPQAQSPDGLPMAPKIFKETCEINWSRTSVECLNHIRGLCPYPAAWCRLNGKVFKIFKTKSIHENRFAEPGTIECNQKDQLDIRCGNGWIRILELQPEGKKRMTTEEYFRGNRI